MKLNALIGWGIVIYAVVYLTWSGILIHGLAGNILARFLVLAALAITAAVATRTMRLTSERDVATYAFGWVIVAMLLDAIYAVPTTGWGMYADWNVWVGYIVLLAVPFVTHALSKKRI